MDLTRRAHPALRNRLALLLASTLCVLLPSPVRAGPAKPAPRRVLAFYYAWYANPEVSDRWMHWEGVDPARHDIGSSTHYPVAGAYDSGDPAVIDRHMARMAEAGIDGPIVSWWGPDARDSDRHMAAILDAAARHGLVVSAYLEGLPGRDPIRSAADQLAYLIRQYGKHPAWLRVDDQPVVFVYGRAVDEMGPLTRWDETRKRVVAATGVDPFLVGDRLSSDAATVFDGLHTYNPAGELAGVPRERLTGSYRAHAVLGAQLARDAGKLACVTIIPGYDDTKIRHPGLKVERFDGVTYDAAWDAARAAGADWAVITTWNEWHEGSEIEPSIELGDAALKATRAQADRFRASDATPETGTIDFAWKPVVDALRGRRIALLDPQPRGVAAALVSGGVPIRVVGIARFRRDGLDPAECPILVYVGGEVVDATGGPAPPLDRALAEYSRRGGLIVWASPEAWPMFRDAATNQNAFSLRLGLPIAGGFERPPAAGYTIRFEGPLAALASRPYPTAGDLRFRPLDTAPAAVSDVTPLARVIDQDGRDAGLAAAAFSYRGGSHAPARHVYVACPVPNAVDPGAFWPTLFAWVAGRVDSAIPAQP